MRKYWQLCVILVLAGVIMNDHIKQNAISGVTTGDIQFMAVKKPTVCLAPDPWAKYESSGSIAMADVGFALGGVSADIEREKKDPKAEGMHNIRIEGGSFVSKEHASVLFLGGQTLCCEMILYGVDLSTKGTEGFWADKPGVVWRNCCIRINLDARDFRLLEKMALESATKYGRRS